MDLDPLPGRARRSPGGARSAGLTRRRRTLAAVRAGAAIAVGAVVGLALGILVSVTTEVPLAPEAGLVLGGLLGWRLRRDPA